MIKRPKWHVEHNQDLGNGETGDRVVLILETDQNHQINHFLDALLLQSHEGETTRLIGTLKAREQWNEDDRAIETWLALTDLPKMMDLLLELSNIQDPFTDEASDSNGNKSSAISGEIIGQVQQNKRNDDDDDDNNDNHRQQQRIFNYEDALEQDGGDGE